jgi:hypothetical protein
LAIFREIHQVQGFIDFDRGKFGLEYGMGFILWLQDGYASSLEGFSYEEDTIAIDLLNVRFEIVRS